MDAKTRRRAVILGHLAVTLPTVGLIPLLLFVGLYVSGPWLRLYYVLAGIALGWQWYSFALPRWKTYLRSKGVEQAEVEALAAHAGLEWTGAHSVGSFALHTTAAVACAIHLSPWLIGRWFFWVLPLARVSRPGWWAPRDYYIQHLAGVTILPAILAGYFLARQSRRLATCAWIIPTFVMVYKLLEFTDAPSSVFLPVTHFTRFAYFFSPVTRMPRFSEFSMPDIDRTLDQMFVVAPFYSAVAYSIGAFAAKHNVFKNKNSSSIQSQCQLSSTGVAGAEPPSPQA